MEALKDLGVKECNKNPQATTQGGKGGLLIFLEMHGGFHLHFFVCAFTAYSISALLLLSSNPWYSKLQEMEIVPNCLPLLCSSLGAPPDSFFQ